MLPTKVIKIDTVRTCFGLAVVLIIDGQRALAFPQQIDNADRDAIDNYHPTLSWPVSEPLTKIREFPSGPLLPGWDILGAHIGRIGEDPWEEFGITPTQTEKKKQHSTLPVAVTPHTNNLPNTTRTAFSCAQKAVATLSPPVWVTVIVNAYRWVHLYARQKTHK